ncbi:MAG: AbiV family abortive infection protein [Actinomycetota bacterium]|nr:AbiV family abortive infection protein [Actinomycetota bacterium]
MKSISRNARELLDDARFLFEGGRHARAAALAILSLEENFKKLMLLVHPLIRDDPQGRREFWRAYANHKVKSGMPGSFPFMLGRIGEEERAALTKELERWADTLKQRGLYADCYRRGAGLRWAVPSRDVGEEEARTAIRLAEQFSAPDLDDDLLLQIARYGGASGNVLEVLLAMADELDRLSEGEQWGPLAEAPENIRRFVERVARELPPDQEAGSGP